MGAKYTPTKIDNTPGPGAYVQKGAIQAQNKSMNKSGFGNTQRVNHGHSVSEVGPGGYDPKAEAVKYKSPSFGFAKGKSRQNDLDKTAPGPG